MTDPVNAFVDGDVIRIVTREDGKRFVRSVPAEWVAYLDAEDVPDAVRRGLQSSSVVRSVKPDGKWLRVGFLGPDTRHGATMREGFFAQKALRHWEGDVDPVRRWMTDAGIKVAAPRRCYLDLETDSRVPFSRKDKARILAWCVVDSAGEVVGKGLLEHDEDKAEAAMLTELWAALEPFDQVLAWNGDNFDFPVLEARTEHCRLRVDPRLWLWLDQLALFKKMNTAAESADEKQSMRLQAIAMSVLGEGKDDFDASKTWEAWEAGGESRDRLLAYNVKDTLLLPRIEQRKGFAAILDALAVACGVFPNTDGLDPTRQVDAFMLKLGRARGVRFPSRTFREETPQFKGAYVMQPKARGITRDVHVADFSGMYPSIILTFNMSPETLAHAPINGPIPEGVCRVPSTGETFRTGEHGMLTLAIRELLKLRKQSADLAASLPPGSPEWTAAMIVSTAYKVAVNAFYGVIGSPFSRYFDRRIAESVSQAGVWLLKQTINAAEDQGMKVIYGDSVAGDRIIVTKCPKGMVRMLTAEELWSNATMVRAYGSKERAELPGWKALAKGEREGWFPIGSIIRHRAGKQTWRLTTKHGQAHVTSDHGIMVDGEEVSPERFVRESMRFTTVEAQAEPPLKVIDLLDHVGDFVFRKAYSRGKEIVRRFVPEGRDWMLLDGWGKRGLSKRIRRRYVEGTPEFDSLLRLVGAYVSDGSASINGTTAVRNLLSFCKADLALMRRIHTDLEAIAPGFDFFGPFWTDTVYVVRSGTAAMSMLFAALCGYKSRGKRLPTFAYRLSRDGARTLVGALGDGDGYYDAAGQLSYTSNSAALTAGISYVLSQHGLAHGFYFRESKGAWSMRTRKGNERPSRYSIKAEVFDGDSEQWVYDLSVVGAHTFVDGIGRVLLHNTDSFYAQGPTRAEFEAFVAWCNAELYPGLLEKQGCRENHVKLAYEKQFDRIVFVGAKKYAATFAHYKGKQPKPMPLEGEEFDPDRHSHPEVKGLEYKRSDAALLARRLQERVIGMLMRGDERIAVYEGLIGDSLSRILNDVLPLEEFVMSKSLSRALKGYTVRIKNDGTPAAEPPHVTVGRLLAKRGREIVEGTRIEYVVIDGEKNLKVIPAEDYKGEHDRYYLWENLAWPPTQRLLAAAFPDHAWSRWDKVRPPKPRKGGAAPSDVQGGLFEVQAPPGCSAVTVPFQGLPGLVLGPLFALRDLGAGTAQRSDFVDSSVPVAALQPALEPWALHLTEDDDLEGMRALVALYPGPRPLRIVLHLEDGVEAELDTKATVSGTAAMEQEIERARSASWYAARIHAPWHDVA